jgi:hypothetical protein
MPIGETVGRVFESNGIDVDVLVKQLKDELSAHETKTLKLKGAVQDSLPEGWTIIAETEEETVIQWHEVNWKVRQPARIDAQKLLGLYPAEKHEHSGPDGGPIETRNEALESVIAKYLKE